MGNKNKCPSKFYFIWFALSIFFGLFVISKIYVLKINLPPTSISGDGIINQTCKVGENCEVTGFSSDVSSSVEGFSKQFESFDNFFPLSVLASFNVIASSSLDSNVYLEITDPSYTAKIRDIKIFCADSSAVKFDSEVPKQEFKNLKLPEIATTISSYFSFPCDRLTFSFSYNPSSYSKILTVGPKGLVKLVTHGSSITVIHYRSVTLEPDFQTKLIIFLVVFFLTLGAGSILFPYLIEMKLIKLLENVHKN